MITELHMEKVACFKTAVNISPKNKISLVYGLNGSGKSTISNYLYDSIDEKYSFCKINENFDHEILVYNQLFIRDYFYEEDSLKGIFTLSKENKGVLEAIENKKLEVLEGNRTVLEEKKLEVSRQITNTRNEAIDQIWGIKQKYAGGDRILEYCLDGLKRKERLYEHLTSIKNSEQRSLNEISTRFWLLMRHEYGQTIELAQKSVDRLNKELQQLTKDLGEQQGEVSKLKNDIVELRKKTVNIEEAIENINNGLTEIGVVGFSVVKHGDNLYKVHRPDEGGNVFHSLSEGEKTVISFLYFLELCKGQSSSESTPRKKVVVIDDPISSLSHIYVFNIGQLIKRVVFNSSLFEQVFLFTHSLYFFYELTHTNKEKRAELQNLYRIVKNSNGSNVVEMKYEEIQNDYQTYWSIVKDDASPPALIANCMRNIVEYFFNFVQKKDFNNVFQKPALSGDKYQAFSRYMNRESHSLGQNIFDIKEFDYLIFREGLSLVFEECGYSDHYKVMIK